MSALTPLRIEQPIPRLRREVILPARPRLTQPKVRPLEYLVELVAAHYGLQIRDLTGRKRTPRVARPRQVAMYLARSLLQASLADIGAVLGRRHHTTVLKGSQRVQQRREAEPVFRGELEALETLAARRMGLRTASFLARVSGSEESARE